MDRHRAVAEEVASEAWSRPDVLAVLLSGSVARREHRPTSDVDLILVAAEEPPCPLMRVMRGELLVEVIEHSESEWRSRFDRPKASWLYSFIEGDLLFDRGAGLVLRADAEDVLKSYRTPDALRAAIAASLWHGQAKLDRAADGATPEELGYWASVFVPSVIDGLFAVRDVPLPAGSRRLHYLDLLHLTAWEDTVLKRALTGTPVERLTATADLVAYLRRRLGAPDLGID